MEDEAINKARIGPARNQARQIIKALGITAPPVVLRDVVLHLRKRYDITVLPWTLGAKTSGVNANDGESCTIAYNVAQHPHHQRFTVGHELGHFLMGHADDMVGYDLGSKDPHEIEANQFAAELLIPSEFLKTDLVNGIKDVESLAAKYNVSTEALWWKVTTNKFLKML